MRTLGAHGELWSGDGRQVKLGGGLEGLSEGWKGGGQVEAMGEKRGGGGRPSGGHVDTWGGGLGRSPGLPRSQGGVSGGAGTQAET